MPRAARQAASSALRIHASPAGVRTPVSDDPSASNAAMPGRAPGPAHPPRWPSAVRGNVGLVADSPDIADQFVYAADWDEALAADWADRLNQRAAGDTQRLLRHRLSEMAGVTPGDRVIELGCGTGHLLAELAAAVGPGGAVLGMEPQPAFAAEARIRTGSFPWVSVHTGSAEKLPLPDASVAAVVAQTVLIHLPRRAFAATLAEVRRVLKPRGRIVSVDQDAETRVIDHPDRETTRAVHRYDVDQLFADGWLGRGLPRLLRAAGFTAVTTEVHVDVDTAGVSAAAAIRRTDAAVAGGAITAEAGARWTAQLREQAAAGDYFASVNYHLTTARK